MTKNCSYKMKQNEYVLSQIVFCCILKTHDATPSENKEDK